MSLPDGSWTSLDGQPTDLVSRVAARATAEPDLAAVVTANGDELSYTELLERATAASAVVRERSRGDGVAVITDRGPSSAIALLAAAMVRCPVALVDDSQSLDRIEALLDRLDLPVIRAAEEFCDRSSDPPQPGDPILILTTSGSTSDPKVALVQSPRWLVDSSTELSARCQLVAADAGSYANVAKYTLAMWRGGTVVALGPEDSSVTGLVDAVVRFGVTRLAATPTLVRAIIRTRGEQPLSSDVLQVNIRGERVSARDIEACRQLFPAADVSHVYASTEMAFVAKSVHGPGDPPVADPLVLDQVFEGVRLMVVSADGAVVEPAPGVTGELVVDGPHRFAGYVGRSNDDVFVRHDGHDYVRSGDFVEFDPAGRLRVLGRVGRRVKIAGMFVDLDEVAVAFEHEPEVAQAAVTSFDDGRQLRLVAHLVPAGGRTIDPVAIRARLASRHPVHMVPSLVRVLDDPPRNAAGKLDHLALARWRPEAVVEEAATWIGLAADPMEAAVLAVVSELAGRRVPLDEDLVNAGFTSLEWVELVERLRSDVGADLEVVHLFSRPTVRGIASLVGSTSSLVPLGAGPVEPPVFWALVGLAAQEAVPLARATAGRTVWVPVPSGFARPGRPAFTVDEIVGDMVGAIRTTIPGSPLVVAGYSTGCHFARAVAARLLELGQQVPLLVLLDPLVDRRDLVGRLRREVRYRLDRRDLRRGVQTAEARHRSLFRLQVRQTLRSAPASFDGPTLLVRSEQHRDLPVPSGLGGSVRVEVVPGGHRDVILHGPTLAALIDESVGR